MIFKLWVLLILYLQIPVPNLSAPIKTSSIIGGYACSLYKPKISRFMVSLTSFWGYPVCGATLISPLFILSAAHCGHKFSLLYASKASDRDKHVKNNGLLSWWCPSVRVADIFPHPEFNVKYMLNDIALMKLDSPMKVSEKNNFVKLPARSHYYGLKNEGLSLEKDDISQFCPEATIVGWGTTSKNNYYIVPTKLMCVELPIIPIPVCRFILRMAPAKVTLENVCAGGYKNKDSCVGDSGGPLLCDNYQLGITSWGPDCAVGLPSVYTRVDKYIDFINNTIITNEGRRECYSKYLIELSIYYWIILKLLLLI